MDQVSERERMSLCVAYNLSKLILIIIIIITTLLCLVDWERDRGSRGYGDKM